MRLMKAGHSVINAYVLAGRVNSASVPLCTPSDSGSAAVEAHCFYQTLEDNFVSQHVDFCTRDDAILDLVITDEPHMVDSMSDLGLFTGSDHKSLYWKLEIRTMVEPVIRRSLDYAKADVDSMIRALKPLDWYNL